MHVNVNLCFPSPHFLTDRGKEVFFVLSVSETLRCEIGVKLPVGTELIVICFL